MALGERASASARSWWHDSDGGASDEEGASEHAAPYSLLCCLFESDLDGSVLDVASIAAALRGAGSGCAALLGLGTPRTRWVLMLDVAKAAANGPVHLPSLGADLACLSFYKLFGEPTGLGALVGTRRALGLLLAQRQRALLLALDLEAPAPAPARTGRFFSSAAAPWTPGCPRAASIRAGVHRCCTQRTWKPRQTASSLATAGSGRALPLSTHRLEA